MESKILTSVIDVPRKAGQSDLFGIDKYKDALVEFIETTSTPITVAIQGEWGSGKTSLMNTLKDELCDQHGKRFYPIWLNTWQFSLMKSEKETLIAIINGLTNELADIAGKKDSKLGNLAKQSLGILGRIAGASVKVAVKSTTGQDVGEVVDAFSGDARDTTILKLRDSLNELIGSIIEEHSDKGGFIFFIDDLDRIDPPVAVNILELLKNIFDLDNCVFILAIDYDVVVKGLEPKFGKLTDKNEREFRSFFDKIIQLPFSMPVASYNIDVFLKNSLEGIGYIPKENDSKKFYENITEIAYNSVGSNPRSLKRLINTLSLISIINSETGLDKDQSDIDKQINFALVCLQVAYPSIYKAVNEEPDFRVWNEDTAIKLKLRKLEDHEIESIRNFEEFDEEWEQILYRICDRDSYLKRRAFNISALLNKIAELVPEDAELGEHISILLELSSVTDVQAFDKPRIISNRTEATGSILENLHKLIPQKIEAPIINIRLPSLKANLNRELWCKINVKDIEYKLGFGILISPKNNKITIKIRFGIPFYDGLINENPTEFLSSIIEKSMDSLNLIDADLEQFCKINDYKINKFASKSGRKSRKDDYFSTATEIIKTYESVEDFNSEDEHERIAKEIVNYCLIKVHAEYWFLKINDKYKSIF